MRNTKLVLASITVIVPLALLLRIHIVKGSEPPGRLVDNGDGTVTDVVTKLTWQQATSATTYAYTNGPAYCAGLTLGTFSSGWRLPSVKELISIVDYESPTTPLIDTAIFPDILTQTYHRYYTSDTSTVTGGSAGNEVNFDTGVIENTSPGNGWMSRCVHNPMTDGGVP